MSNYLVKTAEQVKPEDRNGKIYKTVTFTEVAWLDTPFGRIQKPANQCRSRNINRYAESYLDQKEELGYSDSIFDPKNPGKGGIYQGSIETREVPPYTIVDTRTGEEKTVSSYTCLVFGDTTSPAYESIVKAAFKAQGHIVIAKETANVISEVAFTTQD